MKHLFICLLAILFSITSVYAEVEGTAHDFSDEELFPDIEETCNFCHIPIGNEPYGVFPNENMEGCETEEQAAKSTLLCLSCHDGVIAFGVYLKRHVGETATKDIFMDHPVSFKFDENLKPKIRHLANSIDKEIQELLVVGRIECLTCHDIHNEDGNPHLLRKSNSTQLCITCHKSIVNEEPHHKEEKEKDEVSIRVHTDRQIRR